MNVVVVHPATFRYWYKSVKRI